MTKTQNIFLSAEWRDLVMLNYEVDPSLLNNRVPSGTVLDSFNGKTYLSLVGFRFCHTKLFGSLFIPFHSDFEEVNLRFYVRRETEAENRRGVVFIAEVVPRQAVAKVARAIYGENYVCLPMKHLIGKNGLNKTVAYQWQVKGQWCKLSAEGMGTPELPREGSLEQFITEHYWGYSKQGWKDSLEYEVTHVRWKVWATAGGAFEGDASTLYGSELGKIICGRPDSAFIADGSPVAVHKGIRIF